MRYAGGSYRVFRGNRRAYQQAGAYTDPSEFEEIRGDVLEQIGDLNAHPYGPFVLDKILV